MPAAGRKRGVEREAEREFEREKLEYNKAMLEVKRNARAVREANEDAEKKSFTARAKRFGDVLKNSIFASN